MKSLRSWLIGIAIGATLFFGAPSAKAQGGVPRAFTYQGLLLQNGVPFTGNVTLDFVISDLAGNALFRQVSSGVMMSDGIFNVILGDPSITPGGLPESMTFNEQYALTIVVNNQTTLPAQLLWSSPYALNSERVGGIAVSPTPVNGDLFPMPLNGAGKIDPSMLPEISGNLLQNAPVTSINGTVLPDASGNVDIVGADGITVVNSGNTVTISGPNGAGLTGIYGNNGLTGGGTSGNIYLGIAPGGISSSMLAQNLQMGSITVGSSGSSSASLVVVDSEINGGKALAVMGGIGAGNPTGAADGTGLSPGSTQTYWADQVAVPGVTTTSLQVYNKLVSASSTIIITPFALSANVGQIAITSQGAGTFTITSSSTMGTNGGGSVTGLNYLVINH